MYRQITVNCNLQFPAWKEDEHVEGPAQKPGGVRTNNIVLHQITDARTNTRGPV